MAQGSVASPPERGPLDDNARVAIESSHLRSLVPEVLAELTQGATRLRVPAGRNVYREGDVPAHFNIVVSGLLRVYVTALDGRTMTVRYGRPGAALGVVSLFTRAGELPASVQALTDADLLVLQPSLVRRAAERDVRVARAMIDELSERVRCFIAEIPGSAFATVRQRVARHLLDMASVSSDGTQLAAPIVQQDLAEAVGTAREVVVRALRELRQEGLVRTQRDRIVLLDPERLVGESYGAGVEADPRIVWNRSS
jgi:CRP/FNR family cyclic AMP-dependent transcriptional regulator